MTIALGLAVFVIVALLLKLDREREDRRLLERIVDELREKA